MRLVVTEKPSVAQAVAAVLGARERKDGCLVGNDYIVSWCVGHLVELAAADSYGEKYSKWRREDLPILPDRWQYAASDGKKKQLDILRKLMGDKNVDTIVCATDAGREGELIFRLVYNYCKCTKPVERLWISSMEDSAIRDGFQKLRSGTEYKRLYEAALCRSQADWLVGINATRLFSCLYGVTLNVGRVQTPTLAMLVSRAAEIGAFTKEPFYTPELDFGTFTVSGERQTDRADADSIRTACDGKNATVRSVTRQEKSIAPPKLYDLTTLQREANRLFGYTAQQTLDYAQELYEQKLITYPRTDSRFLTEDMGETASVLVHQLFRLPLFEGLGTFFPDTSVLCDNSKVSDHHAIIPTATMMKTDLAALPLGGRSILHLLATRLLCAVAERHFFAETAITVECEGHSFSVKGKTVLSEGWKEAQGLFQATLKEKPKQEETASLPELSEGQTFPGVAVMVREGFTSPPKHFSEDTLLSAMEHAGGEEMPDDAERKGLGTPATRAGVIEKLVKSGFLERKAKQLLPTDKGRNLIAVLPDNIKSPTLTAEWEHRLGLVERGELTTAAFMEGIAALTRELVSAHTTPEQQFLSLFAAQRPAGSVIGKCPRCGSDVCENKKGFFCAVPSCGFALWRDNKFFAAKKKVIDKKIAAALLKEGRIFLSGLYSERTSKTYDATIILEDTGKYANFKLDFGGK